MVRLLIPLIFLALFVGWLLYRLLIKKDLKQHLKTVYFALFFFAVWGLFYFLILS